MPEAVAVEEGTVSDGNTHLFESLDGYGEAEVWCGDISFTYSKDFAEVTCVECLRLAVKYGESASRRLNALASAAPTFLR